jgi:hypothetical protein
MEHKRFHNSKIAKLLMAAVSIVMLTSCTSIQLETYSEKTGINFTQEQIDLLVSLPDKPIEIGADTIHPNGTVETSTAPAGSKCPQHYDEAMKAGWSQNDWSRLDKIIWRESRCQSDAYNGRGRDNSYGLMQLNMKAHRKWVGPLVEWDFNKLYDPLTNLTIAKELYNKAQKHYRCGWQPWAMRCR